MINLLVVTHGEFGAYLVEAAETIVGRQEEGVRSVAISPRLSLSGIQAELGSLVERLRTQDGLIILTDMAGGTPTNVVFPLASRFQNVEVLSGVNLYMLVTAFGLRRSLSLAELSCKILEDGRRSIQDIKALLAAQVK